MELPKRSLAAEAAVFWMLVPAGFLLAMAYQAWTRGPGYLAADFVFFLLFATFGYGSWRMTRWGFAGSVGLSLIFAVLRVASSLSVGTAGWGVESAIQINAVVEVPALLCAFYAYRAFRELRAPAGQGTEPKAIPPAATLPPDLARRRRDILIRILRSLKN